MRNQLYRFTDTRFTHITQTQNQETGNIWVQGKRKWKCSWAVVCLCLCIQAVKWQKPEFQWIRMSSRVQCVWISWRIQWPSSVDTVTVRSVLQAAGIRRIRWESTAALSADRPSVQDLLWGKTPFWLKWWRNWRRPNYLVTVMLELEMWSVTSVLEENTKPSSPVWCVWNHTVWVTLNNTRAGLKERNTKWLMPLDDCRRWSARNTRSFLRFSVALIRNVYVCCVRRMIIKTTTLYQLQHRWQRNRYL